MTLDISTVPIEIHANKLLEWLISRHHCTKEWPEQMKVVRTKINEALGDMPEHDGLGKILVEASPLNYYHCVKIVEILKSTEAESKNIFGMYGSRRMKDWQEIIKLYQKENLYLAECASILGRNVIYEVPALKRQITKTEQSQAEILKKESNSKKQAVEYREKFLYNCTQLGLEFDNYDVKTNEGNIPTIHSIVSQLISQMEHKLPQIFDKITDQSNELSECVLFYQKFLNATINKGEGKLDEKYLQLLQAVIERGNITTYEWKYGEPPVKIERALFQNPFNDEADGEMNGGDIDFGDFSLDTAGAATGEGDGNIELELETGEIDWGDIGTGDTGAIDYSIVDTLDLNTAGIILEEDGIAGGVAKNEDAYSVLENPETRNHFIDELFELQGFLNQRIDETKSSDKSGNSMIFSDASEDSLFVDDLPKMLQITNRVLALFEENTTKQFLLVRESNSYVTRLAENLLHNLKLANKLDVKAEECKTKYKQLNEEIKSIGPRITLLSKQSKELQSELSKDISAKYNNRPVYLTANI